MFKGSLVALVTPFDGNNRVDYASLKRLIEFHVEHGTNGLVIAGTTGESATLTRSEHIELVGRALEIADGRLPIIAGTGSNSTAQTIELSLAVADPRIAAYLVVVPYYNKPTQAGLYAHFKAVADSTSLPIFVYNVPGRSVADISVETLARLARDCDNIVGTKDATADLTRPSKQRHASGEDFIQLSGEDGTALGFNAHGGVGCISVTANVAPRMCAEFQEACLEGNFRAAIKIQDRLMPLHSALFAETSPAPVKYAASLLDLCEPELRLPMVPVSAATEQLVRDAMVHAGLLN